MAGLNIRPQQNPLMSPVRWDLAYPHEADFVGRLCQERIWTKSRQGLSKAGAGLGREIAGAEIFGRTIKPIAGP
jgi:hypothetical protein